MRHRKAGVHLSRTSAHRKALFSNLVAALLTNERIRTTDAKAKETRRLAERTITWARRVGEVLTKKPDRRTTEESARVVHAVRMARRVVRDRGAVLKLFDEIAPRFLGRRGGYTRIVKLGQRPGDAAPMSLLELMPDEGGGPAAAPAEGGEGTRGKPAKSTGATPAKGASGGEKTAAKARGGKAEGDGGKAAAKKAAGKAPAPKSSKK
jgi:large subunit ribosomal protein L17